MKKSQLRRLQMIDEILYLNPEGCRLDDILHKINSLLPDESKISKRQLQYDIGELKELFDAPINNRKGKRMIKYSDITFSAFRHSSSSIVLMNQEETNKRKEWIRFWIDFCQESQDNSNMLEVIDFGDNLDFRGLSLIPKLLKYIGNRQTVSLEYSTRFAEYKRIVIHPYFIHQYNNRWYLFAWSMAAKKKNDCLFGIRTYALDRILPESISEAKERFHEIDTDTLKDYKSKYFSDIVGVTNFVDVKPISIELRFDYGTKDEHWNNEVKKSLNYLYSKPFYQYTHFDFYSEPNFIGILRHDSLKDSLSAIASMEIVPNYELEVSLLEYCEYAKLVAPEDFKEKVFAHAARILSRKDERYLAPSGSLTVLSSRLD